MLAGTGGLVKEDYGTLVLTGTKIYEGGTFVRGGVLQVAADTNLGNAAGGLVIDNATLRTTGANMISARAVELAGTQGTIEAANGARLTLSGTVSGAASLVKEGLGTLVLNGTNSYDGNTFVNAGRLEGNADSIRGNLANNGETVFDQASNGTFGGKVEGSGLVIKDGDGELILTGGSSAQWQVDGGMLASSALRFTGDVDIGAAGTMTFDQIANAGYGGTLSGSGRLLKTDAGLLELSADSGDFAGTTTVAAGTLRVTNTLGGTVAVEDGASLGGSGIGEFTGAVTIADGGTLLGRQGETLTMGSLTLGDAANVNVALGAPGTLALFNVTGGLTLDGILNVQDLGGFGARPLPDFRLWRCADRQRHGHRIDAGGRVGQRSLHSDRD